MPDKCVSDSYRAALADRLLKLSFVESIGGMSSADWKDFQALMQQALRQPPGPSGGFKYELGQIVYYIADNSICSASILARQHIENQREDWAHTKEQKSLFTPWGPSVVWYATCHGQFREDRVYPSREAMALASPPATDGGKS